VLAHAKRRLFPADDESTAYAVADTQFSKAEWLPGHPVDPAIRDDLAPFNHVRIGGGYPDLVGVRTLESDLLAVERLGDEPPLIAIEAKGRRAAASTRNLGIVQAYDRLHEANAAYLAAPAAARSPRLIGRSRELNVGVLGVDSAGGSTRFEVPRVVGNRTTSEATALRFQASEHRGRGRVVRAEPSEELPRLSAGPLRGGRHRGAVVGVRCRECREKRQTGCRVSGLIEDDVGVEGVELDIARRGGRPIRHGPVAP